MYIMCGDETGRVWCQSVSPWSSTSASDSCQSSIEVKEFYCDDDIVDVSDWTYGNGLVTCRQDGYIVARHARITGSQDAAVDTAADAVSSRSADKTLTAGMHSHCLDSGLLF